MAESQRPARSPGAPGTQVPTPPGASSAGAPQPASQELRRQGQDVAVEAVEQGRAAVRAWQTQLEHQVLEHPLQSLAIAAGIGLLVGLLQRR